MHKAISRFIGLVALVGIVLPSVLFLAGDISLDESKQLLLVATVVWFLATLPRLGRPAEAQAAASDR